MGFSPFIHNLGPFAIVFRWQIGILVHKLADIFDPLDFWRLAILFHVIAETVGAHLGDPSIPQADPLPIHGEELGKV